MFRTRLQQALAILAVASLLQGALGLWALDVASDKVIRGRVASDIHNAFINLAADKQRLRAWLSRSLLLDVQADGVERARLVNAMKANLQRVARLSVETQIMDGSDSLALREHQLREEAVTLLTRSIDELSQRLDALPASGARPDPARLLMDLDAVFDRLDGRDLRSLLAAVISREETALARQREQADASLRTVRNLVVGATLTLSGLAFALALHFSRALRRPLEALITGADALKQGELSHRIPDDRNDEFGQFARRVNAMAAELQQRRQDERDARRQLEELVQGRTAELQQALAALQQIDARRRQLFADISHELRTPTTAIRGEAEITLRGRDKQVDEYKTSLRNIADSARQLGVVIDDLLILARTDVENLALARTPIDAQDVLREALNEAQTLGQERGIHWALEVTPEPLPMLADSRRLRQLLMLILDNAVRYSRDQQTVRVVVRRQPEGGDNPTWLFEVRDQGIGIAPEDVPLVFQRNFRGAHARAHQAQGNGLGLPLADVLCRAHGGKIVLQSELGRGTVVSVTLPLHALEDATPALPNYS